MTIVREQGWCSFESTRLPPMCPGFDCQIRRRIWVEYFLSSLLREVFLWVIPDPVFPISSKTNTSILQFVLENVPNKCSALNTLARR